jgi:hypothetical protein
LGRLAKHDIQTGNTLVRVDMPSMTPILATMGRIAEHDIQTGNTSGILAIFQVDMPSMTPRLAIPWVV